ncbi:MAG: sulfatase-like hydrolase/transferase [Planctomycetaceae bacterium]|nr:sulfatase-like hydrolase/transferase [Planctomycetaceae bacterium]
MSEIVKPDGKEAPAGGRARRLGRMLLDHRLRAIWVVLVFGLLLFSVSRLALFLARSGQIDLPPATWAWCFALGVRYDLMALGYVLLPLVLVLSTVRDETLKRDWFRRLVTGYVTFVVVLGIFEEIVGGYVFLYEGTRPDWMLGYLRHPHTIISHIYNEYPLWLVLTFTVAMNYAVYVVLRKVLWLGRPPQGSKWRRVVQPITLSAMCLLAVHGTFTFQPLRKGAAFITANNMACQLTMNNFFTIADAAKYWLTEGNSDYDDYAYPDIDESRRVVRDMLYQNQDTHIAGPVLWRTTHTGRPLRRPNVVMIIMESQSGEAVGAYTADMPSGEAPGGQDYLPSFTPRMDEMCRQGLFFDHMYAVGHRTVRGLIGSLCGHPDLKGSSLMELPLAQGRFLTLPQIFRQRGYQTMFVYGGGADFDNMRNFLSGPGGIDRVVERLHMDQTKVPGNWDDNAWGLPDEVALDKAVEEFTELDKRGQPFFGGILTISNHDPYRIPPGRVRALRGTSVEIRRLNAYLYADWALGRFFDQAAKTRWYKNTLFVLVADHGHPPLNQAVMLDVPGFRVPCLFYAPGMADLVSPRRVSTICSQADVPMTLLSLLGGDFDHSFMGRNVLALREDEGWAMMHRGNPCLLMGQDALVLPPLPRDPRFPLPLMYHVKDDRMDPIAPAATDPVKLARMQEMLLSYFAVARDVYVQQTYRMPAVPTSGPAQP